MSIMYNNKCIAGSYEDCANTDLSNLTDTGSKMMDGQWVAKTATLSTATAVGTYTIDLSDYLPDDNYNYEVWVQTVASNQNNTNVGYTLLNNCRMTASKCWGSGTTSSYNTCICTYFKNISWTWEISGLLILAELRAYYYRRLGTNI